MRKTTISKEFSAQHYFDLENPRDAARLEHPQLTLEDLSGLITIDEVQRKPDLFPLIRYMVDNKPGQKYLVLGSASRELLKQSSDSLAGRIGYYRLEGFRVPDVGTENFKQLWLRMKGDSQKIRPKFWPAAHRREKERDSHENMGSVSYRPFYW